MSLQTLNTFQVVALPVLLLLFAGSVATAIRRPGSRRAGTLWALVWLAAGVAIARPKLTTAAAAWLGIGRGTDLVLYCAVLVMLIGFWMTYTRLRRLSREITLLTRNLALRQAGEPGGAPNAGERHDDEPRNRAIT
ncbi:MAG: DUF2304 domain-containing protein [Planctomycetes bacterium]|nr:DUF2304 domain-containing protein [Planctomycetota bacterium]